MSHTDNFTIFDEIKQIHNTNAHAANKMNELHANIDKRCEVKEGIDTETFYK